MPGGGTVDVEQVDRREPEGTATAVPPWIVGSTPSTRYPVWTRANVGEVFPDPVGPLSFGLAMWEGAELGWRDAWERIGAFDQTEFRADDFDAIGIHGGYCYLNASVWRVFGERTPGLSAAMIELCSSASSRGSRPMNRPRGTCHPATPRPSRRPSAGS